MIPAQSTIISNYFVVGDTTINNAMILQIQRTDSLSANGEGADGQHRILVTAAGTGSGTLYLDVATGRLVGLFEVQSTRVNVTTSGRMTQFVQHTTETVSIAR
jgi:hypothetical protein